MEEEKRLVHAGTHKELLDQLDEIQKAHDSRLAVAQRRLELTQQAAVTDCEASVDSAHDQMIVRLFILLMVSQTFNDW